MKYIIAGLGNPGEKYELTRHNIGRMVLEYMHAENGLPEWKTDKYMKARVSQGSIFGSEVLFLLPDNYMNNSGESVSMGMRSDFGESASLIVIHDDIDIPFGAMRLAFDRGSGGHNGVRSVMEHLKTREFLRIRLGVAPVSPEGRVLKPEGDDAVAHFVLKTFTPSERENLAKVYEQTQKALQSVLTEGREKAMWRYN